MGKQAKRERKEEMQEAAQKNAAEDMSLTAEDKRFAGTLNYLARGIIIGGSLAVIIGWMFPEANMGRVLGLGLLSGCLAGVTMMSVHEKKKKKKKGD
ncbi:MAG: hypothetical protein Q8O35_12755 [Humidesulfovibrio sp.]|jgi:hypothetical protein|uniref:hypothetical protein n=1 Tax=Humidesulfovibrio sp. TaxID=2910988 RepID=UPI00273281D2|nr:hypothetical protein [Humidesulfovibrio sp.]MDP2849041.1 hypothetical protein [Humidesulfovibrio sp.]